MLCPIVMAGPPMVCPCTRSSFQSLCTAVSYTHLDVYKRQANKLCVAGMNTGLAPAWVRELDEAGGRVSWEWKDYIYFCLLYTSPVLHLQAGGR